jgi:hypothetical protein
MVLKLGYFGKYVDQRNTSKVLICVAGEGRKRSDGPTI